MKLYYSPGACSQAPHIVLHESGLPFEIEKVDLNTKKLPDGGDFLAIAPKGAVPALTLPDGSLLTEGAVVLQYIADQVPGQHLIPAWGSLARYRAMEWLNYLASELHKSFAPLFHPTGEGRALAMAEVEAKLDYVNRAIGAGPWLLGETRCVADYYLFVILSWTRPFHIDLTRWPALENVRALMRERPAVRAALHAEGFAP